MKPRADTSRLGRWCLAQHKHLIVTPELPVTESASIQRDTNTQSTLFLSRPQIKAASPGRRRWREAERRSGLTAGLVKTPPRLSKQEQSQDLKPSLCNHRVPERITQLSTHTRWHFYLCGDSHRHDALLKPHDNLTFTTNERFFFSIMILLDIHTVDSRGQRSEYTLDRSHHRTHTRIVKLRTKFLL